MRNCQSATAPTQHCCRQPCCRAPVQYMKTEAGREVEKMGTASATTRIAFFIFLRVASGCKVH